MRLVGTTTNTIQPLPRPRLELGRDTHCLRALLKRGDKQGTNRSEVAATAGKGKQSIDDLSLGWACEAVGTPLHTLTAGRDQCSGHRLQ